MEVILKRAHEESASTDGFRVLVDRLLRRGKKEPDLRLDAWAKDLAPGTDLRNGSLQAARKYSTFTLIYAAKDTEHNKRSCFRLSSKGERANANSRFSRRRHDDRRSGAI